MKQFKYFSIAFLMILISSFSTWAQYPPLAVLKYGGGGDWYANPTSLKNLAQFSNEHLKTKIPLKEAQVEVGGSQLFQYPFVHMTGHGNVHFTEQEAKNLRKYLIGGGFLHIDDNYGMDPYVRPQMKKVFPDIDFVEIPYSHAIFKKPFPFLEGLPKIHEHDGKPPQAFGLFYDGRLVCLYTYESDLGNGWEDPEVHNDPEHVRQAALKMGANILYHVFSGSH